MKSYIEEINRIIKIYDLARRLGFVPNKELKIHSIYKDEKTPSLQLHLDSNRFHCYATGRNGDVVQFYQDFKRCTPKEAVKELCQMYNIPLMEGTPPANRESEKPSQAAKEHSKKMNCIKPPLDGNDEEKYIYEERFSICLESNVPKDEADKLALNDLIYFRKNVQTSIYKRLEELNRDLPKDVIEYLTGSERNLTLESIEGAKLFYISDVQRTIEQLKKEFNKDELIISGLFNNDGKFVFSTCRLIIPYFENGQIVYLKGRYFNNGSSQPSKAKYIGLSNHTGNLSALRWYNRDSIKPNEDLIITEGEFDSIKSFQEFGINSAAIPGTGNIPKDDLQILYDVNDLYIIMDNDKSGQEAIETWKTLLKRPFDKVQLPNNIKDLSNIGRNYAIQN